MRIPALLVSALLLTAQGAEAQRALDDYEDACDSGDLVSCSLLGLIYQTGAAGERDVDQAVVLWERACAREVASACRRLQLLQEAEAVAPDDDRVRVGYVADGYDGAPLGGAVVRVRGIAGIAEGRYVSDEQGRVVLAPLPYGRYDVAVSRGGYVGVDGEIPVPWDGDFLILMERVADQASARTGSIFGRLSEQGSQGAISDVDVTVTGRPVRAISNRDGRFLLSDLEPGRVELRLERLGYEPRTLTVTVERGRTVELYATMSVDPVELDPVEVAVTSRYLQRSGFYHRAQSVSGDRFTYREIEAMAVSTVGDVVRRAGVTVLASQIGFGSEAISNRRRGGNAEFGRCRLRPYFNGTPLVDFNLELVPPEEIEAMEVYEGANVPIEYFDEMQRAGASCGVVLIWTRDPRRTR